MLVAPWVAGIPWANVRKRYQHGEESFAAKGFTVCWYAVFVNKTCQQKYQQNAGMSIDIGRRQETTDKGKSKVPQGF
jgi:hypothetical protein